MSLFAELLSTLFDRRQRLEQPPAALPEEPLALARMVIEAPDPSLARDPARSLLSRYARMSDDEKRAVFRTISTALDIDPARLRQALDAYEADPSGPSYREYMAVAEPPRQELIRRLNQLQGATEALVRMRGDLLRLGRGDAPLEALDHDFLHLFRSWFNRGFLVLRPINWESPAHILEKIIAYEAVHAIASWEDLRRRMLPEDRRCFALFHPSMPDEPLIFVEVALTRGIPASIDRLLADSREPTDVSQVDTATFYSISNCQPGLAGVSFGNALIKQVAAELGAAFPTLKHFVTLSPVPQFGRWLEGLSEGTERPVTDLKALAAHYLLKGKRADGQPLCPVARFHLANGAILHGVHPDANRAPRGQAESRGVMVNYLYDLALVADRQRAFAGSGIVEAAPDIVELAAQAQIEGPGHDQPAV